MGQYSLISATTALALPLYINALCKASQSLLGLRRRALNFAL